MNGRDYLLTLRPAIAEGYCGGADPLSILDGAESAGAGNSAASRWTTRYLNPGESLPKGYKWIEDPVNPGKIIVSKTTTSRASGSTTPSGRTTISA